MTPADIGRKANALLRMGRVDREEVLLLSAMTKKYDLKDINTLVDWIADGVDLRDWVRPVIRRESEHLE